MTSWTSNGRPVAALTQGPLFVSERRGEGRDLTAEDQTERYRRMRERKAA